MTLSFPIQSKVGMVCIPPKRNRKHRDSSPRSLIRFYIFFLMISFFLSIIYLSKGVTNSSVIFELPFTRVLVRQGAEADAGDDRYDSVIIDFVYMKVALEAGLRRETIHGRPFSEIVSIKITL